MNWRATLAITRRDLMAVARTKAVLIPIIVVPVIFLAVIPALVAFIPGAINLPGASTGNVDEFLARMPEGFQQALAEFQGQQVIVAALLLYFFAPMYLVIPIMVSSVIAADSFAGEKERKTLEALLYTPTTDMELLLGKLLSAWIPAVVIAWGGFVLYGVVANVSGWHLMGRIFFPNTMWVVLALWVAPAVAGLGLGVTVLISMRVRGFQEAYQLGGMVVLPIILLVIAQATGVMYFSTGMVVSLGFVFWAVDAALLRVGARLFRRTEFIAQL